MGGNCSMEYQGTTSRKPPGNPPKRMRGMGGCGDGMWGFEGQMHCSSPLTWPNSAAIVTLNSGTVVAHANICAMLAWPLGMLEHSGPQQPPKGASLHCVLLLDYVPPEEPPGTPLPSIKGECAIVVTLCSHHL